MRSSQKIPRCFLIVLLAIVGYDIRVPGQQPSQPRIAPTTRSSPPAQQEQEINEGDVVRINTTLVAVPVSVMDRKNRYLMNLRQEQFHVFENGIEQKVALFASVDSPFMVGLALDISDSTQAQLTLIQEAAIAFIDQLKPIDKVFVIAFDSRVRLLAQPEMNRDELRASIRALASRGRITQR